MKKRFLMTVSAIALVAALMSMPSVQAIAVSALSVFRVSDAKAIKVTIADIEEAMNYFEEYEEQFSDEDIKSYDMDEAIKHEEPETKTLTDPSEFTGFYFELPAELADKKPSLYATDSQSSTVTINTTEINEALSKLGVENLIDESYNGAQVTLNSSPSIMAQYSDMDLFATQGVNIDGDEELINNLWNSMLEAPFISNSLRSQLSNVNIKGGDVYLPVIMGLGRETQIGGNTGYIYSVKDLNEVLSALPQGLDVGNGMDSTKEGSALLWTKNGVLYCLIGEKSDSELIQIARSIP